MISYVRGGVAKVLPTEATIDVGGIGFTLHCTPTTTADLRVGADVQLAASLVVREDSLTLYGFADDDERTVFEQVQTVSGVGPRLAQAILSVLTPDDLRRAVASEALAVLTKVPGIGKKGAQRMVIELKDKLGVAAPANGTSAATPTQSDGSWQTQVHAALLGLGWSSRDADAAVDKVAPIAAENGHAADVPGLLKAALRTLAKT